MLILLNVLNGVIKSIFHISLTIILLVANAGISVSKHYCHGGLVSIAVDHEAKSCCDMGDCCHNENEFYQLDEDFYTPQISQAPVQIEIDLFGIELNTDVLIELSETDLQFDTDAEGPPPKTVPLKLAEVQSYLL